MRILIAHSFYRQLGGEDIYVNQEVDLLQDGHEVELLAHRNDELKSNIQAARRMTYSRALVRETERKIKTFKPDVIHLHNAYPALGPAIHMVAERLEVPLVMTVHNYRLRCPNGYMFTEGEICARCIGGNHMNAVIHRCFPDRGQGIAYAGALWLHRFLLRLERKVIQFLCPSEFIRDQLITWGIAPNRLRVNRNFTEIPIADTSGELGEYGLYLGRLSPEKGLMVLAESLRLAGDPPFIFVGDGPLRRPLARFIRQLGLTNAHLTGRLSREEVLKALLGARFVAFPSLWHENAPLAAPEAMACSKPLLVTQLGGLRELTGKGVAVPVTAGNVPETAELVRDLMTNDQLCRRVGEAAREFAATYLTPAAHRRRLISCFQSVTGTKG